MMEKHGMVAAGTTPSDETEKPAARIVGKRALDADERKPGDGHEKEADVKQRERLKTLGAV